MGIDDIDDARRRRKRKLIGFVALVGGMVTWYTLTGNPARFNSERIEKNEASSVVQTIDQKVESIFDAENTYADLPEVIETTDGPLYTKDINFDDEFEIETDRYRIVKDKDMALSRGIGWLVSLPTRLILWDYDMCDGLDEERTKQVLATLENDESLSGITVRINHTSAIEDLKRLFNDPNVLERNSGFARGTLGLLYWLGGDMIDELRRGDYYNPYTQTVIVYSNVETIPSHEIGHFKDYIRHDRDWWYSLLRVFPPATLYQEARASLYGKDMLGPDQNYQFYRYLIPAFATYIFAAYAKLRKAYRDYKKVKEML